MQYLKFGFIYILLLAICSCSNKNSLIKDYNCKVIKVKSKTIPDALQKFTLNIPKNWKTKLYIDKGVSIFATADTTKQLSQTFLIKLSLIRSSLICDKNSDTSLRLKLAKNKWIVKKHVKGLFKNRYALMFTSEKQNSKIEIAALHIFFNTKNQQHFEIEIQCFGNKNQQERFCQAINILKTLKLY